MARNLFGSIFLCATSTVKRVHVVVAQISTSMAGSAKLAFAFCFLASPEWHLLQIP